MKMIKTWGLLCSVAFLMLGCVESNTELELGAYGEAACRIESDFDNDGSIDEVILQHHNAEGHVESIDIYFNPDGLDPNNLSGQQLSNISWVYNDGGQRIESWINGDLSGQYTYEDGRLIREEFSRGLVSVHVYQNDRRIRTETYRDNVLSAVDFYSKNPASVDAFLEGAVVLSAELQRSLSITIIITDQSNNHPLEEQAFDIQYVEGENYTFKTWRTVYHWNGASGWLDSMSTDYNDDGVQDNVTHYVREDGVLVRVEHFGAEQVLEGITSYFYEGCE